MQNLTCSIKQETFIWKVSKAGERIDLSRLTIS